MADPAGSLQRLIVEGNNEDAVEILSRMDWVHPSFLMTAISHNPRLIPYIAPMTTVNSDHMFSAEEYGQPILKILASELKGVEAIKAFMLATETGNENIAKIIRESRSPDFLEEAIMLMPESSGLFGYLKMIGFQPGVLYAAVTGNVREVRNQISADTLDRVLNLGLLYDHPEVVRVVMNSDYDKLAILRSAIENDSELAVEFLIDAFNVIPAWIIDLLVKHEYDISRAMTKTRSLQRSAEIAALDGNVDAVKVMLESQKAKPSDIMLTIAIANNNQNMQELIERFIPHNFMLPQSI